MVIYWKKNSKLEVISLNLSNIVNTLALCSLIQEILVKQEKYYMKKD
jgi:hypothetical protein